MPQLAHATTGLEAGAQRSDLHENATDGARPVTQCAVNFTVRRQTH